MLLTSTISIKAGIGPFRYRFAQDSLEPIEGCDLERRDPRVKGAILGGSFGCILYHLQRGARMEVCSCGVVRSISSLGQLLACLPQYPMVHSAGVPRSTYKFRAYLLDILTDEMNALTVCLFGYGSSLVIQSINFPYLRSFIIPRIECTTSCRC